MTGDGMDRYDVVVAGGGAAGVAAARGAADAGARTMLVERTSVLGGAATLRGVATYCGLYTNERTPRRAVRGIADLVTDELGRLNGIGPVTVMQPGPQTPVGAVVAVDPAAVERALDAVTEHPLLDVLLNASVTGVRSDDDRIEAVEILEATSGRREVGAGALVDASGDAVLAAALGPDALAPSSGALQTATLAVRFSTDSGRFPDAARIRAAVEAAASRGEHFSGSPGWAVPLPSGDVMTLWIDRDVDPVDPVALTAATRSARAEAWRYVDLLRSLPDGAGVRIVSAGPQLGVRQSRRAAVIAPVRDRDLVDGVVQADAVALCSWPSEDHVGAGRGSRWIRVGGDGVFGIRLDSLRSTAASNLLVAGRVISGDRAAAAAARVMGTAFGTGHAAGVAASLKADGADLGDASVVSGVRAELQRQGALLEI